MPGARAGVGRRGSDQGCAVVQCDRAAGLRRARQRLIGRVMRGVDVAADHGGVDRGARGRRSARQGRREKDPRGTSARRIVRSGDLPGVVEAQAVDGSSFSRHRHCRVGAATVIDEEVITRAVIEIDQHLSLVVDRPRVCGLRAKGVKDRVAPLLVEEGMALTCVGVGADDLVEVAASCSVQRRMDQGYPGHPVIQHGSKRRCRDRMVLRSTTSTTRACGVRVSGTQ